MDGGQPVNADVYARRWLWTSPTSLRDRSELGTSLSSRSTGRGRRGTIGGAELGAATAHAGNPCKGNFGRFNQMVYSADDDSGPVATLQVLDSAASPNRVRAGRLERRASRSISCSPSFDPAKLVIIRARCRERTTARSAVDCGYGTGSNALRDAIVNRVSSVPPAGAPTGYQINKRKDTANARQRTFACTNPDFCHARDLWDCLSDQPRRGNRTADQAGIARRVSGARRTTSRTPVPCRATWAPDPNDTGLSDDLPHDLRRSVDGQRRLPDRRVRDRLHHGVQSQGTTSSAPSSSRARGRPPPAGATGQGNRGLGSLHQLRGRSAETRQPGPSACDLSVQGLLCAPALVR